MYNACISFQAFLMFYAKRKVNAQFRINFKNESDFTISFSKKREGRKHSTIFFSKGEKLFDSFEMCQFETKTKVEQVINTLKVLWLTMAESDTFQT